ncbi:MAG: VOC family protein [Candidatus Izimaplasma sp.]|nr:VOC family protein [Candidatus Izimaplasma bacterium]
MIYYYHKDAIHISRIDLLVKNLNKSKKFYTNNLGFSILKETNEYVALTVDHKTELIRLHQDNIVNNSNDKMNIYHFAILLPTRESLGKFLHHLIDKQIPIDGAADHSVSEAIYLQDPDGFGIEISCDKDDTEWVNKDNKIQMDTLPFDYKGVYYSIPDYEIFSKMPTETIIGHLHLQVDNLGESKSFYNNIIGFDIVNETIKNAVFMSDKNYHHHLALNSWRSHSISHNKMKSFTITYPNCEKYLRTIENVKAANIKYQETNEGIHILDPENTEIYIKIK